MHAAATMPFRSGWIARADSSKGLAVASGTAMPENERTGRQTPYGGLLASAPAACPNFRPSWRHFSREAKSANGVRFEEGLEKNIEKPDICGPFRTFRLPGKPDRWASIGRPVGRQQKNKRSRHLFC